MERTSKTARGNDTAAYLAQLQQLVHRLAQLKERCDETCLALHDITVPQAYALLTVPYDAELTMAALSQAVGVAGSSATRMVDQLVRKGLVDRRHDAVDRRIVRVALTRRGQGLRREMESATDSCFESAFAEIKEQERPATIRVLELVAGCLAKALDACGCSSREAKK